MNCFRKLVCVSILSAVAALAIPAMADVGTIDFGITNKVINNATTTVNLGSGVLIDKQDQCSFEFRYQGDQAGTGGLTITFARSSDNVNFETTPRFTWAPVLNGNTAVVAWTNFPSAMIGASGYIKVISIANADVNASATNCVLRLVKKTIKFAP